MTRLQSAAKTSGGSAEAQVPIFSRTATGLVRQVSLLQQIVFNLASSNALGLGLVFFLSVVVLFPKANIYVAMIIAGIGVFFVWTTFALLTSAIPRVGGDYTINSRVIPHGSRWEATSDRSWVASSASRSSATSWRRWRFHRHLR